MKSFTIFIDTDIIINHNREINNKNVEFIHKLEEYYDAQIVLFGTHKRSKNLNNKIVFNFIKEKLKNKKIDVELDLAYSKKIDKYKDNNILYKIMNIIEYIEHNNIKHYFVLDNIDDKYYQETRINHHRLNDKYYEEDEFLNIVHHDYSNKGLKKQIRY